ncbi:vacuolar protein sorting 55 [Ancylostoma caninum]|uniref:Vacuolar protein sorting 55 n=2 Tax=Ancylostoma TaxID=29169 RepID=A0A368FJ74_ANCCA|nr:vacuolar protein sorting 55 [Ancylostoma caninum]
MISGGNLAMCFILMNIISAVAALAFAGVLGLTLLVLGCALPMFGNWSPMFVIAFYIFSPVPLMIARRFQEDMTGTNACVELALFITTAIVVSAFALPTVLAHAGTIKVTAMLLVNSGSVVMFLTILAYFYLHREEDSGSWSQSLF